MYFYRFYKKFKLQNIIGCIVGIQVAIVASPQFERDRPGHLYMNRKGYYGINAELVKMFTIIFTFFYYKIVIFLCFL